MSYTFIMMSDDWTSRASRTLRVKKRIFWSVVALVLLASPAVYLVCYHYLAPQVWFPRLGVLQENNALLKAEVDRLAIENSILSDANDVLGSEARTDRLSNSEALTRLEVAENARLESAKRVQELESELISIQRDLSFYQELVATKTEDEVLQCFNIVIKPAADKITYGINFLKRDQKDNSRINVRTVLSVKHGDDMVALGDSRAVAEKNREFTMQKSTRIRGEIPFDVATDGLHFFDVKAYNDEDQVIAHCWKTF